MSQLFNHCPNCGKQLGDRETNVAMKIHKESGLPPLCHECRLEAFQSIVEHTPVGLINDIGRSLRDALHPLVELSDDVGSGSE